MAPGAQVSCLSRLPLLHWLANLMMYLHSVCNYCNVRLSMLICTYLVVPMFVMGGVRTIVTDKCEVHVIVDG